MKRPKAKRKSVKPRKNTRVKGKRLNPDYIPMGTGLFGNLFESSLTASLSMMIGESVIRPMVKSWLKETPVRLCDCDCHVMGIYGGTSCPTTCNNHGARFDGCHRCGCPGTTCPIGECKTTALSETSTPTDRTRQHPKKLMRTDANNNPAAFTSTIAHQAGLTLGVDYQPGDPFPSGDESTARLLGNPIQTTIRVIDELGFYTHNGNQRWVYIALPRFVWDSLDPPEKRDVIGFMYQREGGIMMRGLFPNYGKQ